MTWLFHDLLLPSEIVRHEQFRRQQESLRTMFRAQPEIAANAASIAESYGESLTPETTMALARQGHDASSEVTAQAAQAEAGSGGGGLFGSIGDLMSGAGAAVKAVGGAAAGAADFIGFDETIEHLKPAVRGAVTAFETGAQELSNVIAAGGYAGVRAKGGDYDILGNFAEVLAGRTSVGREVIRDVATGEDVELGSGWFSGDAYHQRVENAADRFMIDGMKISTGRVVANEVTEPGTIPYNLMSGAVDAAVQLAADPAEIGLRKLGQANRARRSFTEVADRGLRARTAETLGAATRNVVGERAGRALALTSPDELAQSKRIKAGIIDGAVRKTVLPERAEAWLRSKDADRVADWLAKSNFDTIWNGLARGNQLPVRFALDAADVDNATDAKDVLRRWINNAGITDRPSVARANLALKANSTSASSRLFGSMPKTRVNPNDPADALEQMDRFQRNARLPRELIAKNNEAIARAAGNRPAMFEAMTNTLESIADHVATEFGVTDKTVLRQIGKFFSEDVRDARLYGIFDEIADHTVAPGIMVDPHNPRRLISPFMYADYLTNTLPLPDAREIRRLTSAWKPVLNNPALDVGVAFGDWFMNRAWKRWVLLRGAWTVRVVGEEQVRMAAAGLDSVAAHPLSAMLWASGRRGRLDALGDEFAAEVADEAAAAADLTDFSRAMSGQWAGLLDEDVARSNFIRTKHKAAISKGEEGYTRSWAEGLWKIANDPVGRNIARKGLPDTQTWFREGAGAKIRHQFMGQTKNKGLATVEGSNAYVEMMGRYSTQLHRDNPELLEIVRTGKLGGQPAWHANGSPTQELRDLLDGMADEIGPEQVVGDLMARRGGAGTKVGDYYDKATDFMFAHLMTKPTNYLSRSPAFRQIYWRDVTAKLPFLSAVDQQKMLDAARATNLADEDLRQMTKVIARQGASPEPITIEQMDQLAKGKALDGVKDLLYDLTERKQFWDISRLIFPFGEAWQEVLSRWAKIGVDQPQVIRRAQQGIEGLREADVNGNGQGIWHVDERTGDEMFAFPGSRFFTKALGEVLTGTGIPIDMKGRVQGLSMVGEIWPGVGPVVQVPAAMFIPDTEDWEAVREILFPFGEPDIGQGAIEQVLPGWAVRAKALFDATRSPEQERLFANATMEAAAYLASTGKYDLHGPDAHTEAARLLSDAADATQGIYAARAIGQFIGPTSPSPRYLAKDRSGNLVMMQKMYSKFQEYMDEDPLTATERFFEDFGHEAFLVIQGKTKGLFPAIKEIRDFATANPEVAAAYPNVYGFFVDHGEGEFDYPSYIRQIRKGERDVLTPNEALAQANHRLAMMLYRQARDQAGDDDASRAWLDDVVDRLKAEYPGFNRYPDDLGDISEVVIPELRAAVADERLAATPIGRAATIMFQARDRAREEAEANGLKRDSFATAKSMRGVREWYRKVGERLVAETPEFGAMWEQVFQRELPVRDSDE